jgi:hypothetical protein
MGAWGSKGGWSVAPKSNYLLNADRCPRFLGAGKRDHFNSKGTTDAGSGSKGASTGGWVLACFDAQWPDLKLAVACFGGT